MTCSTMYMHSTGPAALLGSGRWWWLNSGPLPHAWLFDDGPTTNHQPPLPIPFPSYLPPLPFFSIVN